MWSLIIGEALALGVPVVTYDIHGIKHAYGSCPSVMFVPAKNREALASQILQLLQDERMRLQLSNLSSECVKKYRWEDVAKAERLAYEKLLL